MTVQLDIGGGQITEANMAAAQKLGASRIHVVVGDLSPHAGELNLIRKYGMEGVLDVEIPLWVNIGMNAGADISYAKSQLQACQQAGWKYFSEEGGGRAQIEVIRADGRKFINYGSENGANMYYGQYNHAADSHFENLIEWYHQTYGGQKMVDFNNPDNGVYMQTAKDSYAKCKIFGLTLMMYTTAGLYFPSTDPLKKSLDQLKAAGIPVSVVHMWSGQDVGAAFREPWVSVINFLKSYYGGFAPMGTIEPPKPPVDTVAPADFTWGLSWLDSKLNYAVFVGSTVDKDGKLLPNARINVYRSDRTTPDAKFTYSAIAVSNEGGAWACRMPLAKGANFFWFVTKDGKKGYWTSDQIWV